MLETLKRSHHIFINFNSGTGLIGSADRFTHQEFDLLSPTILMGLRIAVHAFLGVGVQDLFSPYLISESELRLFELNDVMKLLAKEYKSSKSEPHLVFIHIDEVQLANAECVKRGQKYLRLFKDAIESFG